MEDCSSFSNTKEIVITHAVIELTSDFLSRTFDGRVTYTLKARENGVTKVVLDIKHIEILSVPNVAKTSYGDWSEALGGSLVLNLLEPLQKGEKTTVTINFKTTEKCTAVQFLERTQTAGKNYPFCYTQCEPIHCRTMIPVQDSPGVKFTIEYRISVKPPLVAVCAGEYKKERSRVPGYVTYYYVQKVPVPSYLVAFAIGNIESQKIGPRSTLYTEPILLESAAYEFGETESFLRTAEELVTPYFWGKLDILLLPPSFPFGGMENPSLVFLTPTILAGDRSLTSVIAHEIAHSWTGNGVTNATWEHFWLNEGFTVYIERKIIKKLYGVGLADLNALNGIKSLEKAIQVFGEDHNFTKLNPSLEDIDPDDAFSCIPYEKGSIFLRHLESLVGEEVFLDFLKEYFEKYKGRSIVSKDFQSFFASKFQNVEVDWKEWLQGTGMPPVIPDFDVSLLESVNSLYNKWRDPEYVPDPSDIEGWHSEQIVAFLEHVLLAPEPYFLQMGETYSFVYTHNSEIKMKWLLLVIDLRAEEYYEQIKEFLTSMGRMKYVRPLFREMFKKGLSYLANEILTMCQSFYHPTLQVLIQKEFQLTQ